MSIQSHIAELERRHAVLEKQIADAVHHPSVDEVEVKALKQRKLQLKDEITRLSSNTPREASRHIE